MGSLSWADVLVGEEGRTWRTVPQQRTVLVVVHTVTAATRLLDVLDLWSGDHRIQNAFTCPGTSAFTTGSEDFLRERGIFPIPWHEATRGEFDLVIAASYGGPLHELRAPLIVLPHGIGYNKFAPGTRNQEPGTRNQEPGTRNQEPGTRNQEPGTSTEPPVFGLSESTLLHNGQLVPSVAVLSHEEQRTRLGQYCPEALESALVAGDPCFDRVLASRPLRETYRQRLGVHPDQRLVLISSTWAEASLHGRDPSLITRLARRLPLDEHRLVVALHPNLWFGHTPWQVRSWIAEWVRAGVVVLPPEEGWRAAVVACDLTLGDHGSVTFYSAALGNPVLLASWPLEAVDPDSPIAALLRAAPRLDTGAELRGQIDTAIDEHEPARYEAITAHTTSVPGGSATVLRSTVYSWLALDEPAHPAEATAVPLPAAEDPALPLSQVIHATVSSEGRCTVTRWPAAALEEPDALAAGGVLVTSTTEPTRRWLESADVLVHADVSSCPQRWAEATLAQLPAARIAAIRDQHDRWVVSGTSIPPVRFSAPVELGPVCAAFAYSWVAGGRLVAELPAEVRFALGKREVVVPVETS